MNSGQIKFYNYLLKHVKEEEMDVAKELLQESFKKQKEGTFDQHTMQTFQREIMKCIKTEEIESVLTVLSEYRKRV